MDFAKKLNVLMDLSGVTNSQLAKGLSVDASLVSRWRKGLRTPVNNLEIMQLLGKYFSERLSMEYQQKEERRIIGKFYDISAGVLPRNEIITLWLKDIAEIDPDGESGKDDAGLDAYIKNISLLLHVSLQRQHTLKLWCMLDQPEAKVLETLPRLAGMLLQNTGIRTVPTEYNFIFRPDTTLSSIISCLYPLIQARFITQANCSFYMTHNIISLFDSVTFAVEDVGGLVHYGDTTDASNVIAVYEDDNLEHLHHKLLQIARNCTRYSINQANPQKVEPRPGSLSSSKISGATKPAGLNNSVNGSFALPGNAQYNAFFMSDKSGVGKFVQGDSHKYWDLSPQEMIGRSALEMEQKGNYSPSITRLVLENSRNIWSLQTTKTGKKLLVIGMPVINANGEIMCIVNLSSEIQNEK